MEQPITPPPMTTALASLRMPSFRLSRFNTFAAKASSGPLEPRGTSGTERDRDVLGPHIVVKRFKALLAPEARLPDPTEGRWDAAGEPFIDEDLAGPEPVRHAMRTGQITGEDTRDQPIGRTIGDGDGLFLAIKGHHAGNGAKDLFLGNPALRIHFGEDGGCHEVAGAVEGCATGDDPYSLRAGFRHHLFDGSQALRRNDGRVIGIVQAVTNRQAPG